VYDDPSGLRVSAAPAYIVRNLKSKNGLPCCPSLCCENRTGPRDENRTKNTHRISTGDSTASPSNEPTTSIVRLTIMSSNSFESYSVAFLLDVSAPCLSTPLAALPLSVSPAASLSCNGSRYSAAPFSNSRCRSVEVFPLLSGGVVLERPGQGRAVVWRGVADP
jgi:hypothetical protein